MFLERHSRYIRRYEIVLGARKSTAPIIPMIAEEKDFSVFDALSEKLANDKASVKQANGDTIELIKIKPLANEDAIALLFHRTSPDAADPTYRKKRAGRVSVRTPDKDEDEEQSVSCHMVIKTSPKNDHTYLATLEEIPGLSMALVQEVIAAILRDYTYKFSRKGADEATYCTIKVNGIKSETVADALQTGRASFITLTRPAPADYTDGDGLFVPQNQIMKLRIQGEIQEQTWRDKIGGLLTKAKRDGWKRFNVEISLPEKRTRQVSLDIERIQNASEILFVRSDLVDLPAEIGVCSVDFHDGLIEKSLNVLRLAEQP